MDINRLRKLSGISEDPMQAPPKKRPPMPRPGMPTPDKPSPAPFPSEPYPVPGGPPPKEPDRPQPMPTPEPDKPSPKPFPKDPYYPKPKSPPRPTPPSRRGLPDFEGDKLIYMPPPDWDGWDEFRDPKKIPGPALPKKPDDTVITSPSLRDYLKMVRR